MKDVTFDQVFKHFGSQNKLAGLLNVSTQAISSWKKSNSVPPKNAIEIEKLSYGKFKAVDLVS